MPEDESDDEWKFSVDEFDDSGPGSSGDDVAESGRKGPGVDGSGPHADDPEAHPDADAHRRGTDADGSDAGGHDGEGNVAGEFAPQVPVVPEMPELENAVFVTLGAILTVLAFAALVGGPSFGAFDALTVVTVVSAVGAALYVALVRFTPDT